VLDPLWAKGIIIDDGGERMVLCAVDWCGIGGATHALFRRRIADAAGTDPSRVAVHVVHQHTAPYVEGDAYALLETLPDPPLRLSSQALDRITRALASSIAAAAKRLQPVDRIGIGTADVDSVASARRILGESGDVIIRFSTSGKDPKIAALPEGSIDPVLRTLTFNAGDRPLVRLHYYATHPQTFCCDGRVSADFVGAAREEFERQEKVPQIYFTGCAGDVTVGKYNDTSRGAYDQLKQHLIAAMQASARATRFSSAPATAAWKTTSLELPAISPKRDYRNMAGSPGADIYRAAISAAFAKRTKPLDVSLLTVGDVRILHLPGEPMLAFQRYAQQLAGESQALVAGYGDISPGYLCTDEALRQGGYEPSASNVGPGTEARLKEAIRKVMAA
jgi:hypothetical protein